MAKSANQKLKILYLMKILLEKTDETHSITMPEIISALESYGISAERKSIYSDIESLKIYGLDIIGEAEGKNFYYHVVNRQFELAELKLLVDSVQSAKFITEKKSNELIKKIESFGSKYEAQQLQRQVYTSGRIKTMNESIYYNVDLLHSAINENYYLIAFDAAADKIKHYRVDKMLHIGMTGEKREGKEYFEKFDMAAYAKKMFRMFDGTEETVKIECHNNLAGVIIDRFGKDVTMIKKDVEHFTVNVRVAVSKQFLAWVMALGDEAKIVGPESVVEQVKKEIARLAQLYKDIS